jgi:hypothetical protein
LLPPWFGEACFAFALGKNDHVHEHVHVNVDVDVIVHTLVVGWQRCIENPI